MRYHDGHGCRRMGQWGPTLRRSEPAAARRAIGRAPADDRPDRVRQADAARRHARSPAAGLWVGARHEPASGAGRGHEPDPIVAGTDARRTGPAGSRVRASPRPHDGGARAGVSAFDPIGALRILSDEGVRFVVIGGYAGGLLGAPLITNDLDICYDRSKDNLV